MLLMQPGMSLGSVLDNELKLGGWEHMDVAVAWVRMSGLKHLGPSLRTFAASGASVRFVVGVDLRNTSSEALDFLMKLGPSSATYVSHNESNSIFHPKLYLFRKRGKACLIVGSNNITEPGLYTNTEATVRLDRNSEKDPLVLDALKAIDHLILDPSAPAKRLDSALLTSLQVEDYVRSEGALQQAYTGSHLFPKHRIFGYRFVRAPQIAGSPRPAVQKPSSSRPPNPTRPLTTDRALVAELPAGGNRWSQAGFDLATFTSFFGGSASTSATVLLYPVDANGQVRAREVRSTVAVKSQNYRVELGMGRGKPYPSVGGRPIAVLVKMHTGEVLYFITMPGDPDYASVQAVLLPSSGRSVRRQQMTYQALRKGVPSIRI